MDIHSKIVEAFENKEIACCVFLDFAKAFDTVNHKILLKKLDYYGIIMVCYYGIVLKWFDSYLCSNRPQCVKIGNTLSDFVNIVCGVPQGMIFRAVRMSYTAIYLLMILVCFPIIEM